MTAPVHAVSVEVEACDNCAVPVARLTGPTTFRSPCEADGQYSTVFLDSSGSRDASGRDLLRREWGIKTGSHAGGDVQCAQPTEALADLVAGSNG